VRKTWLTLLVTSIASAAAAQDAPPPNYVAIFAGTTPAYRPKGGPWDGHQKDAVLTAGIGRYFTAKTALEIDFGPTLVSGEYAAFSIVPGVVYQFSPHAYLAARFPITVDPDTAVYAAPGFGLSHTFKNNLTPTLELNGVTRLDENRGDLAVSVTLGLMYSF
jgi:hypothetical protein